MKPLVSLVAAAVALATIPIAAQWPNYSAAAVPRTPDGKVILDAPAPKAADGHPDLSGIWDLRGGAGRGGPPKGGPGGGKGGPGGGKGPQDKGAPPPPPPDGTPPLA
ncbi:MAG TPA: hypothetical protein VGJ09_13135, partial [Bryobacteraceae bacterium]